MNTLVLAEIATTTAEISTQLGKLSLSGEAIYSGIESLHKTFGEGRDLKRDHIISRTQKLSLPANSSSAAFNSERTIATHHDNGRRFFGPSTSVD